jgi:acetyl esterase/lipase
VLPKITNYATNGASESTAFFGLQPGDPRSDLILAISKDGSGLSLLLNGVNGLDIPVSPTSVAAISPLSQLRLGNYHTPTFIIHSRRDEIVPFRCTERFVEELKNRGVACGLLDLDTASHLHDLRLRPGMKGWDEQVLPGLRFFADLM